MCWTIQSVSYGGNDVAALKTDDAVGEVVGRKDDQVQSAIAWL